MIIRLSGGLCLCKKYLCEFVSVSMCMHSIYSICTNMFPDVLVSVMYAWVHGVQCIYINVVLSVSLPLAKLWWHALYTLIYNTVCWYVCLGQRMLRECVLVQAVCVCVYRHIAAAGHHLWPSPPSGLLWLQIVPLGSQGLSLWISEMARHRDKPARLDGSRLSVPS